MQCTLCNEYIEEIEFEFGDAVKIEEETVEECWHIECYYEYFEEALPEAV